LAHFAGEFVCGRLLTKRQLRQADDFARRQAFLVTPPARTTSRTAPVRSREPPFEASRRKGVLPAAQRRQQRTSTGTTTLLHRTSTNCGLPTST